LEKILENEKEEKDIPLSNEPENDLEKAKATKKPKDCMGWFIGNKN